MKLLQEMAGYHGNANLPWYTQDPKVHKLIKYAHPPAKLKSGVPKKKWGPDYDYYAFKRLKGKVFCVDSWGRNGESVYRPIEGFFLSPEMTDEIGILFSQAHISTIYEEYSLTRIKVFNTLA